jgi:hypothetical protein
MHDLARRAGTLRASVYGLRDRSHATLRGFDRMNRSGSAECGEKSAASLLAPAAAFRAEPAVLMVGRVTLAFVATYAAGRRTCFDHGPKYAGISGSLACGDAPGCRAEVAAVETDAYAADQVRYVGFGQVRVCTARATVSTVRALGDTANEHRPIKARRLWVRLDDLSNGHVCSSFTLPLVGL